MRAQDLAIAERGTGLLPLSPHPFSRCGRSASLRSDRRERNLLDEIDHFTGESESQRRSAPMVIAEGENVDRFQMKSVIGFAGIRTVSL